MNEGKYAMKPLLFGAAIALLLGACVLLTLHAEAVLRYTTATASHLHAPLTYVRAVLDTEPRPNPPASAKELP